MNNLLFLVKEMINKCVTALKASPVRQLLSQFSSSTAPDPREILQEYIYDFVQTVYNAGTDSELNVRLDNQKKHMY